MEITIMKSIMESNQNQADQIKKLLKSKKILMLNLIGSPGAGKTAILEKVIIELNKKFNIAVIEGDIATDKDAQRLNKDNVPVVLINTDGDCHLNSVSIKKALDSFDLDKTDIIFIENVGNLVCPTEFDLGENHKIAVVSTAEGEDKPSKYPKLFREAGLILLNKIDLMPYVSFNKEGFTADIRNINSKTPCFDISCTKEEGLDQVCSWITEQAAKLK